MSARRSCWVSEVGALKPCTSSVLGRSRVDHLARRGGLGLSACVKKASGWSATDGRVGFQRIARQGASKRQGEHGRFVRHLEVAEAIQEVSGGGRQRGNRGGAARAAACERRLAAQPARVVAGGHVGSVANGWCLPRWVDDRAGWAEAVAEARCPMGRAGPRSDSVTAQRKSQRDPQVPDRVRPGLGQGWRPTTLAGHAPGSARTRRRSAVLGQEAWDGSCRPRRASRVGWP